MKSRNSQYDRIRLISIERGKKKKPNYKNPKTYNTAHYPIRQPLFFTWLIWLLCKIALIGKKYKVEKINMEGLKPPYMVLSNHM